MILRFAVTYIAEPGEVRTEMFDRDFPDVTALQRISVLAVETKTIISDHWLLPAGDYLFPGDADTDTEDAPK